ncbi:MAG TPA: hypothetical protein VHX14_08025 [Thermoanaerobaculia bacterium]|jgi:hypothetical protein|nr:hypothetical protein [Thermoanaerobaculia bacterium]
MKRDSLLHRLVFAGALSLWFVLLVAKDDPALIGHTTGTFGVEQCPPTGDANATSAPDPYLNALKNRDIAPGSYTHITVTKIIADVPAARMAKHDRRDRWTEAQRESLRKKEETGIEVIGYLAGVNLEDPESCNCKNPIHRDHHMWLVPAAGNKQAKSMVVELSPRLLDAHPNWPKLASKAWHDGTLVRIRGWRMWDQEHPEQLHNRTDKSGKLHHATRATLWEIHPIHEIEVQDANDQWVPIESGFH